MDEYRIYLDTSVVNFLYAEDAPQERDITKKLWKILRTKKYRVYISDRVLAEISRADTETRERLVNSLNEIEYIILESSKESETLTRLYIENKIVKEKDIDDARHIAITTVNYIGAIVSWNFKHIVNLKTIYGINGVNRMHGYPGIEIVTPEYFIEEDIRK